MSQAPRTLGEADVYVRRYTSRRERRRAMRNLILLITAVAGGWFFWVTRDNWPVARLVPKDPAFQICAMDLLMNRKEIAASRVWDLAPPNTGVKEARTALSGNFGLPEWMINNLMNGLGLISGADLRDPESAIFVTRISRIGRLLETFRGFAKIIEDDPAGGLDLRHVKAGDAYYAIRGRVLVASRSRAALVHALTMNEDETLSAEDFRAVQEATAGRNLLVTVRPDAKDPFGDAFERVEMTFALKQDAAQLECKAVPRASFAPALAAIFGDKPPALQPPVQGLAEITGDFGRPFPEVYAGLLLGFPDNSLVQSARKAIEGFAQSAGDKAPMLAKALSGLGTGFSLSWTGIDPYEVIPAPQIIARIDAPQAAGYGVLLRAALKKQPEVNEAEQKPWFDDTTKIAQFPVFGGPSLHPAVTMRDQKIVITSSTTLAQDFVAGKVPMETEDAKGNLMLRIHAGPAAAAILDAGQEFADSGYLKGFTPESFRAFADDWKARAALMGDIYGLLQYANGTMQFRLTMTMAPPAEAAPAPSPVAKGE